MFLVHGLELGDLEAVLASKSTRLASVPVTQSGRIPHLIESSYDPLPFLGQGRALDSEPPSLPDHTSLQNSEPQLLHLLFLLNFLITGKTL